MALIKQITLLLLTLILISSLVNNGYFESPSMAAYFFYVIVGAGLIVFAATSFVFYSKTEKISNPFPIFLLAALTIYYFFQDFFIVHQGLNSMHVFLLVNCLLLVSYSLLFKLTKVPIVQIYKIITVLASLVSCVCFVQFFGVFGSLNKLFPVTGTWVNPTVSALFLVMAVPATLSIYFKEENSKYKKIYLISFVLILIALLLLKCRTALLGALIVTLIIGNSKYHWIQFLKNNYKGIKIIFPLLISTVVIVLLITYFYYSKQSSTEGRKLIWKISTKMITQKPITGYGYGMFEHFYNLEQANYFSQENATIVEIKNSSDVNMAYNEFLQNAVEGGISALLILIFLFLSLLIPFSLKSSIEVIGAYTGIIAFVCMSVFNFTVQAIPAMALFILYAAIVSINIKPKLNYSFRFRTIPIFCILFPFGICIGYTQLKVAKASAESRKAFSLSAKGKSDLAIYLLSQLEEELGQSEYYWTNYGVAYLRLKKYAEALQKFKKAARLKSYPRTYIHMAFCYQKLGNTDSAIAACITAKNMIPNRLTPLYALMMIYANKRDSGNAITMAKQIIETPSKIPSAEANYYKLTASKILRKQINPE